MQIKDPTLRSCYSHPLLSNVEEDIDDYRDKHGCNITEECFKDMISKYQSEDPEEANLLYDLSFENFLEKEDSPLGRSFVDSTDKFEGCGDCEYPSYDFALKNVGKNSDDMWEAYDKTVHSFGIELCNNITDKEKVLEIGTRIALYQITFDEETSVCLHTIIFVLKTLVPARSNSKYQNSIKRAELWLQEAFLI
uniref:Uncharacterized protein n=1 Tax=viral metagenome TaxID=1070528 RepID=A0A6C0J357_9ZZZZ